MNRIQYLLDDDVDLESLPAPAFGSPAIAPPDAENPHCIFTPQHYEPNYAYPLIVWLHGPDDDQRQVNRVMPLVSLRNYTAVGPRGRTPARFPAAFAGRRMPTASPWPKSASSVRWPPRGGDSTLPPSASTWPATIAAGRWPCGWR